MTTTIRTRPPILTLGGDDALEVAEAGGKGANLTFMIQHGLAVPDGFVVSASAFLDALDAAGVRDEFRHRIHDLVTTESAPSTIEATAAELSQRCREIPIPEDLAEAVRRAYGRLGDAVAVAVRSSATEEDTAGASFAGIHTSLLNVVGPEMVLDAISTCWSSVLGPRALAYRVAKGLSGEASVAVVVQRCLAAEAAGVMFGADPVSGDPERIVVEAARGLGEVVVGGEVEPDTYVLDPHGRVLERRHGHQHTGVFARHGGGTERLRLDENSSWVLDEDRLGELAAVSRRLAELYPGVPQDTEWLVAQDRLWIVQTRPITTPGTRTTPSPSEEQDEPGSVLVRGLGASSGEATGRVRVLSTASQGSQLADGEILVAPMTAPDWMGALRRAGAIVTDGGGTTCHAAIVARELGIPCVVGTRTATRDLATGTLVTVDATHGTVMRARTLTATSSTPTSASRPVSRPVLATSPQPATSSPPTGTRIMVNLARTEHAEEVAAMDVDGVGLLRAEFLVTEALGGEHPRRLIERDATEDFIDAMAESVGTIARAFAPRPVIYRAIDFRSNEFRALTGGEDVEPVEANPMIGYRGCYRYLCEPDLFGLELEMLARVHAQSPNLALMIPFVRTPWELAEVMRAVDASPLGTRRDLQRWIMAEVPSVVYSLPTYARLGIHGVSIGSNDLTQLMLGVDRDSEICSELFDERDPAVLDAIAHIIATCRHLGLASSLCGQAPSNDPRYAEHLVAYGIDSISVDPGSAPATRRVVAAAERRVLLGLTRRSDSSNGSAVRS